MSCVKIVFSDGTAQNLGEKASKRALERTDEGHNDVTRGSDGSVTATSPDGENVYTVRLTENNPSLKL